jgi:DNA-binding transcriptional ArsR family regulator
MTEEYPDSLIGIELTAEGIIPEKEYDLVTEGDISEVLADSVRSAIIGILRHGIEDKMTKERIDESIDERVIREKIVRRHALSVTEISRMSKDPELSDSPLSNSQIYHHLSILIDAGYVIKYGVVKRGGRKTDYYRRTAKIFVFEEFPGSKDNRSERTCLKVEQMVKFFGLNLTKEQMDEYRELKTKAADIEHAAYSKLLRMVRRDVANAEVLYMFEDLICTHSIASDEWIKIRKRMREILFGK